MGGSVSISLGARSRWINLEMEEIAGLVCVEVYGILKFSFKIEGGTVCLCNNETLLPSSIRQSMVAAELNGYTRGLDHDEEIVGTLEAIERKSHVEPEIDVARMASLPECKVWSRSGPGC